jgi:hypothetical protein
MCFPWCANAGPGYCGRHRHLARPPRGPRSLVARERRLRLEMLRLSLRLVRWRAVREVLAGRCPLIVMAAVVLAEQE